MSDSVTPRPVLAIDLGGTKILAAVVDGENRILGRSKISTPAKEGGDSILAAILAAIDQALAETGLSPGQIAGVGIG
jgi:glucokinase